VKTFQAVLVILELGIKLDRMRSLKIRHQVFPQQLGFLVCGTSAPRSNPVSGRFCNTVRVTYPVCKAF
jgi:hypothetical protein